MAMILRHLRQITKSSLPAVRHFAAVKPTEIEQIPVVNPDAAIKLSETCVARLREIGDGSFLRIIVEGGGCSGFQYKLELDDKMQDDDLTFGLPDAQVVVDKTSLDFCQGSIVDYHTELIRAGFRIVGNPKAEQGCSCGASFSIKF